MQTAKEIFLEMLKPGAQPERQLKQYEALHMCLYDPINTYLRGNCKRGTVSVDRWGTTISFPEDAPGAMPLNHGELAVCRDITRWRETVHAPDIEECCPGGYFIPSITYGVPGAVYPHVDQYINQAIDEYNALLHVPGFDLPPIPRRVLGEVKAAEKAKKPASEEPVGDSVLDRISAALCRGQQKKLLNLCQDALDEGISAVEILRSCQSSR